MTDQAERQRYRLLAELLIRVAVDGSGRLPGLYVTVRDGLLLVQTEVVNVEVRVDLAAREYVTRPTYARHPVTDVTRCARDLIEFVCSFDAGSSPSGPGG